MSSSGALKTKIYCILLYFSAFIFYIYHTLRFAVYLDSSKAQFLNFVDWVYEEQFAVAIVVSMPSILGYLFVRSTDYIVRRNEDALVGNKAEEITKNIIRKRIAVNILDIALAILLSFLTMSVFYFIVESLGWTSDMAYLQVKSIVSQKFFESLFASIREEILFRLFLMSALIYGFNLICNKRVSIALSTIVSSILFGSFHFLFPKQEFSWYPYLLYVTCGLVLGFAYFWTKSLAFSLGFHFGWNFSLGIIPVLIGFILKNQPDWYYIFAALVLVLFAPLIYLYSRSFLDNRNHWLW